MNVEGKCLESVARSHVLKFFRNLGGRSFQITGNAFLFSGFDGIELFA